MPVVAAVPIFAGGAALATGTLTVFQTIAAIGGIVGGIGALTGNKTLMKIGAVAGLAGGVGAFAQSQGWLATGELGSAMADTAVSNTAAMAQEGSALVQDVAPVVDAGTSAASNVVSQGIEQAATGAGATAGLESGMAQNITQTSGLADGSAGGLMNAGATEPATSLMDSTSMSVQPPATAELGAGPAAAGAVPAASPAATAGGFVGEGVQSGIPAWDKVAGANGGGSSLMDVIGKFGGIFKNKDGSLNKDMLSMAGNFIGGAFDSRKAAEADWLDARTDEIRGQIANANDIPTGKWSTRRRGPIFKPGRPTYNAPRPGGLMNAR